MGYPDILLSDKSKASRHHSVQTKSGVPTNYPPVNKQIAIENGPVEILIFFPLKMGNP